MDKHTPIRKAVWWLLAALASAILLIANPPSASLDASPKPVTPDCPPDGASSLLAASPTRNVAAPASDPDDPYTHWRVEFNTGCQFTDHLLPIPVGADPEDMDDITLIMTNWDVDYEDESGECPAGAEVDRVTSNSGRYLGILRGADEQWSTNSWPLQRSDVVRGDNVIQIDTDSTGTGCWCVGVGWAEIRAKVGFHVKSASPPDKQQGVPFKQNEAVIDITFNMNYDPETITPDNVYLYYVNQGGGEVKVPYTKLDTSTGDVLHIQPNADLKDGVKYEIKVTKGVKNTDGKALEKEWTSSFWTLLDLTGKNASNQDKIETVPIQVSRDSSFIPKKPAVYRVFIRWDKKADVHEDWQIDQAEFDLKLQTGAQILQQHAKVKRPDLYTTDERRQAESSVNLYHTPSAGETNLDVEVIQTPQLVSPPQSFTGNDNVAFVGKSPKVEYEFWNVRANAWMAAAVPNAAKIWGQNTINEGAQFTTDTFPVIKTKVDIKGDTFPFNFTKTGTGPAGSDCPGCDLGTCPPYTVGPDTRWEWECTARRLWAMRGGAATANKSPWVAGMAPAGLDPSATGWQWDVPGGGKIFIIQYGNGANAGTVAHEAVHAGGIPGHVNNIDNVNGFRVRLGANKSHDDDGIVVAGGFNPEGNKVLTNLMNEAVSPASSRWIDHNHYQVLINYFQNLAALAAAPAAANTTGYLLLSGDIVSDSTVLLEPVLQLDFATYGVPTYTVPTPYSIAQYSGVNLLNTTYFSPTYMGDDLHVIFPGSTRNGVNPPPGSRRYLSFVTAVPVDVAADRVEIQHNGAPIKTIQRTAHAPQVAFVTPANGATLTGTVNISWTVSDLDAGTLYTMLQWSEDGGENYASLTGLVSGVGQYQLDTKRVHSTNQGRLKLVTTDGFNTSEAVINVTFDNPPGAEAYEPASGATGVSRGQPISVWFNSAMQASQFISDELSLECGYDGWFNGTLTYDSETRQATLTPFKRLPYDTLCQAYIEAGLTNDLGQQLPEIGWTWIEDTYYPFAATWSFRTAPDTDNPVITEVFPRPSEKNVPVNALVAVLFDDGVKTSTINSNTLYLADAAGTKIAGTWSRTYDWSYDDRPEGAVFRPSSPLLPGVAYTATVTTGITDWNGNALEVGKVWSFTTGNTASAGIRLLGEYGEWVEDEDHDGKYDRLMIDVAIESTLDDQTEGSCDLNAQLLDKQGNEVGWAALATNAYCDVGVYRKVLAFSGAEIRSHGVDGPYFLDEVYLYYTFVPTIYDTTLRAYATRPYSASDFAAVLTFGGLPDMILDTTPVSINLTQYAWHATLPITALNYTLVSVTDPQLSASMVTTGVLEINAPALWSGQAEVFVRASDGTNSAVDSFMVTRSTAPFQIYLPLVKR